jgi:hypothetical protein
MKEHYLFKKYEKEKSKMEENAIVTTEGIEEGAVTETNKSISKDLGLGALVGSVVTVAVIAGVKKLKKVLHDRKIKKALEVDYTETEEEAVEDEIVDSEED